jgi:hypothetical protein
VNRAERRQAASGHLRPPADLALTQMAGAVYLGLRGAGFIRLSPGEARSLSAELAELAEVAQGALS